MHSHQGCNVEFTISTWVKWLVNILHTQDLKNPISTNCRDLTVSCTSFEVSCQTKGHVGLTAVDESPWAVTSTSSSVFTLLTPDVIRVQSVQDRDQSHKHSQYDHEHTHDNVEDHGYDHLQTTTIEDATNITSKIWTSWPGCSKPAQDNPVCISKILS